MSRFPYNDENRNKMDNVVEQLVGTCNSLEDALQDEFGKDADTADFDGDLLRHLDDGTMLCEGCGWWAEPGELDDEQLCPDCQE